MTDMNTASQQSIASVALGIENEVEAAIILEAMKQKPPPTPSLSTKPKRGATLSNSDLSSSDQGNSKLKVLIPNVQHDRAGNKSDISTSISSPDENRNSILHGIKKRLAAVTIKEDETPITVNESKGKRRSWSLFTKKSLENLAGKAPPKMEISMPVLVSSTKCQTPEFTPNIKSPEEPVIRFKSKPQVSKVLEDEDSNKRVERPRSNKPSNTNLAQRVKILEEQVKNLMQTVELLTAEHQKLTRFVEDMSGIAMQESSED